MKKLCIVFLALCLLLTGCGTPAPTEPPTAPVETAAPTQAPTAAPTEAPTQAPTAEPTAPVETTPAETTAPAETTVPTAAPTEAPTEPQVFRNPLNGEIIDEPFTGRVFANTISNVFEALPHVGVTQADILMEMYVNNSIHRCLALYTDIESVEAIGSTRSTRLMFNDIAEHYSLVLSHAGGSSFCLGDANDRGLAHYNIDSLMRQGSELAQGVAYRDKQYKSGEHNLFGIGAGIKAYAESEGVPMTLEKDYGLTFTENGTPADGQDAASITVTLTYGKSKKDTTMEYDAEMGKYVYNQFGMVMADQITGETEAFTNVIIMLTEITDVTYSKAFYHSADFLAGGTGFFANGGKLIPITWTCDGDTEPFRFFTADGEPLDLGVGNTYIAIAPKASPVVVDGVEITATEESAEETTAG